MIDSVFIVGPTGIGKTKYAIDFALKNNGEIVSADSMQLYKYMDIGSAKPTPEERAAVPHYLVDEIDPRDGFSVFQYQQLALQYIRQIAEKGKLPVICGGTGLYINALVYDMDFSAPEGSAAARSEILQRFRGDAQLLFAHLKEMDPAAAEKIHPNNVKRVLRAVERLENGEGHLSEFSALTAPSRELNCRMLYLCKDRKQLYEDINRRVDKLYEAGLEEEVRNLMARGFTAEDVAMKGIGYKEIIEALSRGDSAESVRELIQKNTRHYAKRQITWFNRYAQAERIQL